MNEKFRWGILGTGAIAKKFAADLQNLPDAECFAVGSRKLETAKKFAKQFHMPIAHGSYADLIADEAVDAIYLATPHPFHIENTLACLEGGKPVLCEKPFAINAKEAATMISTARDKGVFLMEAMWSRFLPVNQKVREWLDEGLIGDPLYLMVDFGFKGTFNPVNRLYNPALGGGALLDVGIYTTSYASMVFQSQPMQIAAVGSMGKTGVDEQNSMLFTYENGAQALLRSAIRIQTEHKVRIEGTRGAIVVPDFWHATEATLSVGGKKPVTFTGESGYQFEAAEVMRCVRAGEVESKIMPLNETLAIMETMDVIRGQMGLTYPME
ncbi:MAG: Gfo/Idh/MocA family oxidoreductase [Anaerolineaceae bacterium]|nr:Gfo/Idh/MocA family oxidoreductase [Anaerolineaceae bacterium]